MPKFISYSNLQRFMTWIDVALIKLQGDYRSKIEGKQDILVSGTSIKTLNNQSLLGQGNISITPITSHADLNNLSYANSGHTGFQAEITDLETIRSNASTGAAINPLVPSQANANNQLADKNFVNSSISTNTAYFRGTYNSVTALNNYDGDVTPNDYAFVKIIDSVTGLVKQYDRYKWNATSWVFEYTLNNSSFTSDQWATINSGVVAQDIEDIWDAIDTKQDTISDLSTIRSGASKGNTALQASDVIDDLEHFDSDKPISARVVSIDLIDYIDQSISYTMNYIMQEDAAEHAGRVAGDDLIKARLDTIEGKEAGWDAKQDALTAGTGIAINNNVVSVTPTIAGSTTVSSISSIPVTHRAVLANISANSTLSFASLPVNGYEVHTIIHNTGSSTISVTLPSSGSYVCTSEPTIYIAAGKYGEVNIINIGGTGYVHGINSI